MVYEINQKMKSVLSSRLLLLICFLIAIACKKNLNEADQTNTIKTFTDYLGGPIEIDLKGQVFDNNETPLDSVLIIVGNKTKLTDKHGNFTIKNVSAHEKFVSLETQRKDYKNIVLNLVPKKDTDSTNIILHKETEPCLFWFCKDNHNLPNAVN